MTRFGEEVNYIDDHDAYLAVLMVENARKVLAAGFTTVRDTGSPRDMTMTSPGRPGMDCLLPPASSMPRTSTLAIEARW